MDGLWLLVSLLEQISLSLGKRGIVYVVENFCSVGRAIGREEVKRYAHTCLKSFW